MGAPCSPVSVNANLPSMLGAWYPSPAGTSYSFLPFMLTVAVASAPYAFSNVRWSAPPG